MFSSVGTSLATLHSRIVRLSMDDPEAPAATFGLLHAAELELVLEGPLLPLALRYIPYTNWWNAFNNADRSESSFQVHYLDDNTEPPSGIISHALALTSEAVSGKTWRVVYHLILEEVEPMAETPTMKRIGYGVTRTDREWARGLLHAPVARVRIV